MLANLTKRFTTELHPIQRSRSNVPENLDGLGSWPVLKQIRGGDLECLGTNAYSPRTSHLSPRTKTADKAVSSICPYCAVGCGQLIYVKKDKIIDIEGDPRSPISGGCLCPKGAATFQLVTGSDRVQHVLYRRPYGAQWEQIPLEQALDMVAERIRKTREETWEARDKDGHPLRRTMGIAHLGGATLDNEENYLIKKLFNSLGMVQIENQARI
jgi:formate dehydrogenase major subunit